MAHSVDSAQPLPIRFWWGFKRKDVPRDRFISTLGDVFLPTTVQVMHERQGALSAYLPIVPPDLGCIDVPDELALVVYKSVAEYERATKTLDGRAYRLLHDSVFGPPSTSGSFPERFDGELQSGQATYLWSNSSDWMQGHCSFFLGRRLPRTSGEKFQRALNDVLCGMSPGSPESTPSAILVRANSNIVTYVELWTGDSVPNAERMNKISDVSATLWKSVAAPVALSKPMDAANVRVSNSGDFLNLQF